MPYPNGQATASELEAEALRELDHGAAVMEGDEPLAMLCATRAVALANLAVAARIDALADALPGAGRGA